MRLHRIAHLPSRVLTALVLGLVSTLTTGALAVPSQAATPPPITPSYLFTVEAASGSTSLLPPRGTTERFTLTLRGLDPVTKFTDRPFRNASLISPSALDRHWETWFASSPPNAVLTWQADGGSAPASFVVTLRNPRYDARARALTFTAERIPRDHDPAEKGRNWQRETTPATFTTASLFIDNATSVTVNGCTITSGASCPGADLSGANLSFLQIRNADFSGALMRNVRAGMTAFLYTNLSGVDFSGSDLQQSSFYGGSLAGANLSGLDLTGIALDVDDMTGANFSNARLASIYGDYRSYANGNFTGADFTNASLENADFTGANLSGANLTGAALRGTEFSGANLTGATVGDLSVARTDGYTTCPNGSRGPCVPLPIDVPNINDREPDTRGCPHDQFNFDTGKWETVYSPEWC